MKQKLFIFSMVVFTLCTIIGCSNESDVLIPASGMPPTHHVSIDAAKNELTHLITEIEGGTRSEEKRQISEVFSLSECNGNTRSVIGDSLLVYVFNFADNQGFAIMSGDDRLPSVLAFAESGNLKQNSVNNVPAGFADYLYELDKDLDDIVVNIGPIDGSLSKSYGDWQNTFYNGAECKVKWGQETPYNKHCPTIDGKHCVTGCVATACAQLMAVYKFPYTYAGKYFNWNEMTASSNASNISSTAKDQLAWLMYHLGTKDNLDMNYGLSESGAYSSNIPRTLKSFGFSNGGKLKDYNSSELKSELIGGFPVLLSGSSIRNRHEFLGMKMYYTYEVGHQWLAHGLLERKRNIYWKDSHNNIVGTDTEVRYYVRYNWGWNGGSDGYYLIDVFDSNKGPDLSDSTRGERDGEEGNFKFVPKMVTGIRK